MSGERQLPPATVIDGAPSDGSAVGRVDAIDFLFTVVIAIGLTPELLGRDYIGGILSEGWIRSGTCPSWREVEHSLVLLLGILTLTLSWYGYHRSTSRYWSGFTELSGLVRFETQIFMVILYGVLMLLLRHSLAAIVILAVIFLLYILWDMAKIDDMMERDETLCRQYPTTRSRIRFIFAGLGLLHPKFRRQLVTAFWFLVIVLDAFACQVIPSLICVLIAILAVIAYRVNKEEEWPWERLARRALNAAGDASAA
jgi:hypothetical protein